MTNAAGGKVTLAVDCVSVKESLAILGKIVSAPGKVALLLPIKEGSTITGNVEEKLYMNLPDDINPFAKDVKVFEIKTFLYQQVCLSSFFTHPDGADVSLLRIGRSVERKVDAEDPFRVVRCWAH